MKTLILIQTDPERRPERFHLCIGTASIEIEDGMLHHWLNDLEQVRFQEQLIPTSAPAPSDPDADQGGSDRDLTSPHGADGIEGQAVPGQAWSVDCPNATAKE